MSRSRKWPAKAKMLNLLIALAMAISLCLTLAPLPALAQGPDITVTVTAPAEGEQMCIGEEFTVVGNVTNTGDANAFGVVASIAIDGCAQRLTANEVVLGTIVVGETKLATWTVRCTGGGPVTVTVNAVGTGIQGSGNVTVSQQPEYTVDVDTYVVEGGVLVPRNEFASGQCFLVNATITNATCNPIGNSTDQVEARISFPGGLAGLSTTAVPAEQANKIAAFNDNIPGKLGSKRVADVWWQVCCTGPGTATIQVDAYLTHPVAADELLATKSIPVYQEISLEPDVIIRIIEPIEDSVTFCVSQQFVVKAEIENLTGNTLSNFDAFISFPASVELAYTGGGAGTGEPDPATWNLDDLAPYGMHTVAWQLHCKGAGSGTITVDANYTGEQAGDVQTDGFEVDQLAGDATLSATLATSKYRLCAGGSPPTGCGEMFTLTTTVANGGCNTATDVQAILSITEGATRVAVTEAMVREVEDLGPGETSAAVVWNVRCIAPGNATFEVTVDGTDLDTGLPIATFTTANVTVNQLPLKVDIIDPAAGSKTVHVGMDFPVTARIKNCSTIERNNIAVDLMLPPGAELAAGYQAVVRKYTSTGVLQDTTYVFPQDTDLLIAQLCPCCWVEITWTLHCKKSVSGMLTVTATDDVPPTTVDTDSASATIIQQCKAHLMAGTQTFPGLLWDGTFVTFASQRISVGSHYTLVVPVHNVGAENADNVTVSITYNGPALITQPLTKNIGTVPGGNSIKAIWDVECTGLGTVEFTVTNLTGIHHNSGLAIDPSNTDTVCPIAVEQVVSEMDVEIINPEPGTEIDVCTDFSVKALITNLGGGDITGVTGTLYWSQGGTAYAGAELILEPGAVVQPKTKNAGDLPASGWAEVSWVLHCTAPGDLYIKVTATSQAPSHVATDDVWVVQIGKPAITINILSPAERMDTWVATSQEFAVTARVNSTGSETAEDVWVDLYTGPNSSAVGVDEIYLGDMDAGTTKVVTFTVHCDQTGYEECNPGPETIEVGASAYGLGEVTDSVMVMQYPAAHLVATIDSIEPGTTIGVCDEFTVTYVIENTGEADAWEVGAVLSVFPEGSVRIAEATGGYTQFKGTVPGWGSDTNFVTGTFTLHCKEACESTLTITPVGLDECGWHPVPMVNGTTPSPDWGYEYDWAVLPGRAIDSKFIEPVSQTVKQVEGLDLGITKTADKAFAGAEETVVWTVVVTNYGPGAASSVVVDDTPPGTLVVEGLTVSQGNYSGGVWTVGSLAMGMSATMVITTTVDSEVEITNTASVSCANVDGFPQNNTASYTINAAPVTSKDIALRSAWNLISLPLIPDDSDITVVLSGLTGVVSVAGYTASATPPGTWATYDPGPAFDDLDDMVDGAGYWVYMSAADTLTVDGVPLKAGAELPPSYAVVGGDWNLVGFKSTAPMAAGEYLNAIAGKWSRIYGYANGQFFSVQSGDMMVPGYGYWVAVTADGTVYP